VVAGNGERVAEYDVCHELPLVLGDHASAETEKVVIDYLESQVLSGARALIRARMKKDVGPEPGWLARRAADLEMEDGVDEALASLAACLRVRSRQEGLAGGGNSEQSVR
jgi:hypothetical protein